MSRARPRPGTGCRHLASKCLRFAIALGLASSSGASAAGGLERSPGNVSEADLLRQSVTPGSPWRSWKRPPRSWRAIRDEGVTRQAYDYSCGSAALATLLSGLDASVSEREILDDVLSDLSPPEKRQTMEAGLSLLHLKMVSESRGWKAGGYRVPAELLAKLTAPVIVFIQPRGYRHFAVLRGIRGDRVFLADPARGNVRFPIWRFMDMWLDEEGRGVIFVVGSENSSTLSLADDESSQPELMGAHAMMRIGAPGVGISRTR